MDIFCSIIGNLYALIPPGIQLSVEISEKQLKCLVHILFGDSAHQILRAEPKTAKTTAISEIIIVLRHAVVKNLYASIKSNQRDNDELLLAEISKLHFDNKDENIFEHINLFIHLFNQHGRYLPKNPKGDYSLNGLGEDVMLWHYAGILTGPWAEQNRLMLKEGNGYVFEVGYGLIRLDKIRGWQAESKQDFYDRLKQRSSWSQIAELTTICSALHHRFELFMHTNYGPNIRNKLFEHYGLNLDKI